MKLQPDRTDVLSISGYGPGWVGIGTQRIAHSLVVGPDNHSAAWNCARFEDLNEDHFGLLAQHRPELVIFGSGLRIRFPKPALVRGLIEQRIGLETMDTLAACRTYNILAAEGRRVIAALLLEN